MKKGFLSSTRARIASVVAVGSVLTTQASAALAAEDVDMSGATDDVTLVFKAILGVVVILFGFNAVRKVLG